MERNEFTSSMDNPSAEMEKNEFTSPSCVAGKVTEMERKDLQLRMEKKNLEDMARNAGGIMFPCSFFLNLTYAYWHFPIDAEMWSLIPKDLLYLRAISMTLFLITIALIEYDSGKTRIMIVIKEAAGLAEATKLLRQRAQDLMASCGPAGGISSPYDGCLRRIASSNDSFDEFNSLPRKLRFLKLRMVLAFAPIFYPFAPLVASALCMILLLVICWEFCVS